MKTSIKYFTLGLGTGLGIGIGGTIAYYLYSKNKNAEQAILTEEELEMIEEINELFEDNAEVEREVIRYEDIVKNLPEPDDEEEEDEDPQQSYLDEEEQREVVEEVWDESPFIKPPLHTLQEFMHFGRDGSIRFPEDDEPDLPENPTEKEKDFMYKDPNSQEALDQYKNMRLADFEGINNLLYNPNVAEVMRKLFDFPFVPVNTEDSDIWHEIVEEREIFFGEDSVWVKKASIAELILYFAEAADYDLSGDVHNYCDDWLNNLGIGLNTGAKTLEVILEQLTSHIFISEEHGFGLFGLDEEQYSMELLNTPGLVARYNEDITFALQYDIWLNAMLDDLEDDLYENEYE